MQELATGISTVIILHVLTKVKRVVIPTSHISLANPVNLTKSARAKMIVLVKMSYATFRQMLP